MKEEINELRARLLELGHPVIIRGSELKQPETTAELPPSDITVYPYFEVPNGN